MSLSLNSVINYFIRIKIRKTLFSEKNAEISNKSPVIPLRLLPHFVRSCRECRTPPRVKLRIDIFRDPWPWAGLSPSWCWRPLCDVCLVNLSWCACLEVFMPFYLSERWRNWPFNAFMAICRHHRDSPLGKTFLGRASAWRL